MRTIVTYLAILALFGLWSSRPLCAAAPPQVVPDVVYGHKAAVPCQLVTVAGGGHGFTAKQNADIVLPAVTTWFAQHLKANH
jgi:hypothetical protein